MLNLGREYGKRSTMSFDHGQSGRKSGCCSLNRLFNETLYREELYTGPVGQTNTYGQQPQPQQASYPMMTPQPQQPQMTGYPQPQPQPQQQPSMYSNNNGYGMMQPQQTGFPMQQPPQQFSQQPQQQMSYAGQMYGHG